MAKGGINTHVFRGIETPIPERGMVNRENQEEKIFWEAVDGKIKGFVIYECLEPFVRKEIINYLEENKEGGISSVDLKKAGKDFFEKITQGIKSKLMELEKDESNVDVETVTALFGILLEKMKKEQRKERESGERKETNGRTTILRKPKKEVL